MLKSLLLDLLARSPLRSLIRSRLPVHGKGYAHYWENAAGAEYRKRTFDRQHAGGTKPLIENPTYEEIQSALDRHQPKNVLEVGCGWGRILEELSATYDIEGCDLSEDLLAKARKDLKTFKLDIVSPPSGWVESHQDHWDVVFCRAVMMYFYEQPEDMRRAMATAESIAKTKVIVWEWPHIIERMKKTNPSKKFEYHPLSFREE
jgi:SAM-dependent methyltransferase